MQQSIRNEVVRIPIRVDRNAAADRFAVAQMMGHPPEYSMMTDKISILERLPWVRILVSALISMTGIAVFFAVNTGWLGSEHNEIRIFFEIVCAFLVAAVPIELTYNFFREARLQLERNETAKLINNQVSYLFDTKINQRLSNSLDFGFDGFLEEMDFRKLFDDLKPREELWWFDTYSSGVGSWFQHIRSALDRPEITIRMLILDPCSPAALERGAEISGFTSEIFVEELKLFIDRMREYRNEARGELDIRIYDGRTPIPAYVVCEDGIPNRGFSSMYLKQATQSACPHFVWQQGPVLDNIFDYIKLRFDNALDLDDWLEEAGSLAEQHKNTQPVFGNENAKS